MIMVSKWYLAPQLESDCHVQQKAHGKCSLYQRAHAKACGKYSPTRVSAPPQKSQVLLILNINRMSRLPLKVLRTLKGLLLPSLPEQKFA